jgi:hypothetical protein
MSAINPRTDTAKDDPVYRLTPLGLLGQQLHDKVILLMVKFGDNAIVLEGGELKWESVEKGL